MHVTGMCSDYHLGTPWRYIVGNGESNSTAGCCLWFHGLWCGWHTTGLGKGTDVNIVYCQSCASQV